ncbi:MAG: ribosome silencing factor [Erysipelotrichaceae bacterium]
MNQLLMDMFQLVDDRKAQDIIGIDFKNEHPMYDYFIIATAINEPMMIAIVDRVVKKCKELDILNYHIEGRGSEWVLIEVEGIVIHLFLPNTRLFYRLEQLFESDRKIDFYAI